MHRLSTFAIAAALPAILAAMPPVNAQDARNSIGPALQLELKNQQTARTGGPIPLIFDLIRNDGETALLEGTLHLSLTDGMDAYGRYVSHEMAISPGRSSYRILLPSIEGRSAFQTIDVHARFVASDGRVIELDSRPLRTASDSSRFVRVDYCDPTGSIDHPRVSQFLQSLRLEQFEPEFRSRRVSRDADGRALTVFDRLRPSDMPSDPHWLCVSSLVVLSRNGFSDLRPKQLDTLLEWVRAGGSICIEPLGTLDDTHMNFLHALTQDSATDRLAVDERGQLIRPAEQSFALLRCGLGTAVVLFVNMRDDLDISRPEWKSAVAALWHLRSDQIAALDSNGRIEQIPEGRLYPNNAGNRYRGNYNSYAGYPYQLPRLTDRQDLGVRPIQSVQGLLERLMPQDVEVVPLPYIGLILVLYLLTIGPLDYFVLGAFRARRFTWITFPLATVGFTLFTVWLSNAYLSSSAERTYVEFLDIAPNGDIVRSNRLELLFTMSSSSVSSDVRSGIFTALDHSRFGGTIHDQYRRPIHRRTVPAATVVGRPPGLFSAVQAMPKWTPQINRIFQIAPGPEQIESDVADFDWQTPRNLSDPTEQARLQQDIGAAFGSDVTAVLYHGRNATELLGSQSALFQETALHQVPSGTDRNRRDQWLYTTFLWDSCARLQGPGMFGVVSRVAPHGGANFEDMTILDPSDPHQWLLVVAQTKGENVTIYRRLYHDSCQIPNPAPAPAAGSSDPNARNTISDETPSEAEND